MFDPKLRPKPYPERLENETMLTLEQLIDYYEYPILDADEIKAIHERTINWLSLDGEIVIRKVLKSFPAFCQAANFGYLMTPYHYSLTAGWQAAYEHGRKCLDSGLPYQPGGQHMDYGVILLSASPQTGKSLSITESAPAWLECINPRIRQILLGYSGDLAVRFGRRNRDKFAELAPKLSKSKYKIHDKIQSGDNWETMIMDMVQKVFYSSNGGVVSAGLLGLVTGQTANYMQIDDPVSNMKDAQSETMVANGIEIYQSSIETRMRANRGIACIMCTRWVPNDMHGWTKKHRKKYIIAEFNYAALCTEDNFLQDPLHRIVGEGICPQRGLDGHWARTVIESYMASGGAHVANALYQGAPSNMQGNLFKDENWEEYEIDSLDLNKVDRVELSIDATFKDNDTSDFVAMELWAAKSGNSYLRYIVRKQLDLPDTLDVIIAICKKFPEIDVIRIEDKANGPGIISIMRKWRRKLGIDERDFPSVVAAEPKGGKYSRAQTASVLQREGKCYLPKESDAHRISCKEHFDYDDPNLSYVGAFKQELSLFPFAGNDDMVDSYSQYIINNMAILTGEEKVHKKVPMFSRYSKWWPEMWQDYNALKTREDKDAFIHKFGAPEEWRNVRR